MATVVYQGLQSCLESQLVESRTLRLRLSQPKPALFSQSLELAVKSSSSLEEKHSKSSTPDMGKWSFLQVLSDTCLNTKDSSMDKEKNTYYVHPLNKRYSSKLSEKSLELCTENLGSESGSDIADDSILSLSSSSSSSEGEEEEEEEEEAKNCPRTEEQQKQKPRQLLGAKKANPRNFPPPLTTMSGSESVRVRSHRGDGRLVIEAVKTPSTPAYFQAERSHGRLRLSFVKDYASYFDSFVSEENEGTENDVSCYNEEKELEEMEEELEEEEIAELEAEEGNISFQEEEEMEGNQLVGAEMEIEEIQRPSRCKEGEIDNNKGLLNWELVWVATS